MPRYDGGEKRLRSDHCEPDDPSEVVVEFSTPTGRFRVTRSPEYLRPAKRGGGMTKQASAVALDEWTDVGWIGRAARAVDVAGELDEILQLSREQFLQVILLAQNRFSEFLLAGSRDRQALLRRLFGTQRFEDVQARFDERRRVAEHALGARLATVEARVEEAERLVSADGLSGEGDETPPETVRAPSSIEDRLDALRRAKARADYRAERRASEQVDAEKRSAAADESLAVARDEQRAQRERDRARSALERLEAEAPLIDDARAELAAARAAEALRSTIAAVARAHSALAVASRDEQDAHAAGEALGLDVDGDLEAWTAAATRESGAWQRARELEESAPTLDAEVRAAEEAVVAATARIEAANVRRAALPDEIAALHTLRDETRRLADRGKTGRPRSRRQSYASRRRTRWNGCESPRSPSSRSSRRPPRCTRIRSRLWRDCVSDEPTAWPESSPPRSATSTPVRSAARSIIRRRPRIRSGLARRHRRRRGRAGCRIAEGA